MRKWYKCDGGESRKNILDGARLNPKHHDNRQSAAKPEKESSTTIPLREYTKAGGSGQAQTGKAVG